MVLEHIADEGRKDEIERVKQQQLREQKEGKNTWKEDIASDSESVVSAIQSRSITMTTKRFLDSMLGQWKLAMC